MAGSLAGLMAAFTIIDRVAFPQFFAKLSFIRFAVGVPLLAAPLVLLHHPRTLPRGLDHVQGLVLYLTVVVARRLLADGRHARRGCRRGRRVRLGPVPLLQLHLRLRPFGHAVRVRRVDRPGGARRVGAHRRRARGPRAARSRRASRTAPTIADRFDEVSVLFVDIVGFTPLAERLDPRELVRILDRILSRFDALVDEHGVEKITTIGDAYMVAAACR